MSEITIRRTIGESEARWHYLNLTDDNGESHGSEFPPPRTPLVIITENKKLKASIGSPNQIWGSLHTWYNEFEIQAGVQVKFTCSKGVPLIEGRVPVEIDIIKRADIDHTENPQAGDEIDYYAEISVQMEKDLEDYLVGNLGLIEPGLELYVDAEGCSGRQYVTPIGKIDLLCVSNGRITVVELKKGRSSDSVVGQISRYIGWAKENLANERTVNGIIIVHEFDEKLKYAVAAHDNLDLKYYRIQIEFISEDIAKERSGIEG